MVGRQCRGIDLRGVARRLRVLAGVALAAATPPEAVTVRCAENVWWRGIPPAEIYLALEEAAVNKAGAEAERAIT